MVANGTGHAGGASDPTIIQDAIAASRAPGCSSKPLARRSGRG
jgi:hypothetical protein